MPTQTQSTTTKIERGITKVWDQSAIHEDPSLPLIDRVLTARDLTDDQSTKDFLNPSLAGLHNPSLIPDLDKAAQRILDAIQNDEPIVIFGDYDVDGVTASAILVHMIEVLSPNTKVSTYIPHRIEEGYGLNCEAIQSLASNGAKVIITVDCGITAIEPAQTANELGVDLIITDHHNPPEALDDMPSAFAVVHPRRPDSNYPFGELCGAGVAYKLAWRLATLHCQSNKVSTKLRTTLVDLLALASLGSIADVVPLIDENRVITKFGLSRLQSSPFVGLRALIEASDLGPGKVDAEAVGFRLAPRLNAIGRLGHAGEALELLTSARGQRARDLAQQLSSLNEQRRATEQRILRHAEQLAIEAGMTSDDTRAIILAHEDWHPGVVGIVCSRLVDRYARPTILMQIKDGVCKGSARSIDGFSIHAALESCADHLTSFGGHDMAAGLACDQSNFASFAQALTDHTNSILNPEDLVQTIRVDASASVNELDASAITTLKKLAPFGAGNPRVCVLIRNARINGRPEPFGKTGAHLSLRIGDADNNQSIIRVVGWNWWKKARDISPGSMIDLVVEPKLSRWKDRISVEPILCDLRVSDL